VVCIESELRDFLLRDRIGDLIGSEEWDNDSLDCRLNCKSTIYDRLDLGHATFKFSPHSSDAVPQPTRVAAWVGVVTV